LFNAAIRSNPDHATASIPRVPEKSLGIHCGAVGKSMFITVEKGLFV
jgi:hypothetical protein